MMALGRIRATVLMMALIAFSLESVSSPGAAVSAPGTYAFDNVTNEVGIDAPRLNSWGATWGDTDGDGDPDLLYNRHWNPARFFLNESGEFSAVRGAFEKPGGNIEGQASYMDRHGCTWGEVNGDGKVDMFCAQGAQQGGGEGANEVWVTTASGWRERAEKYGLQDLKGRGRVGHWFDYDQDGDLDLFVSNHRRKGYPSVTYMRRPDGGFKKVNVGLSDEIDSFNSSWSDWDGDGDPDVTVFRYGTRDTIAYENVEGRFQEREIDELTEWNWQSGSWGDYDGDGLTDVHLVAPERAVVLHNEGDGEFTIAHEIEVKKGLTSQWLDVDNDTDLDLFVAQGRYDGVNQPDFLLVQGAAGGFEKFADPTIRGTRAGKGDALSTADYDQDGRMDVFVTNASECYKGPGQDSPSATCAEPALLRNTTAGSGNWIRLRLDGSGKNPWGIGARIRVTTPTATYWREVTDNFTYKSQSDMSSHLLGLGPHKTASILVKWGPITNDCVSDVLAGSTIVIKKRSHDCDA